MNWNDVIWIVDLYLLNVSIVLIVWNNLKTKEELEMMEAKIVYMESFLPKNQE